MNRKVKKYFGFYLLVAVVAFMACRDSEDAPSVAKESVQFTVVVDVSQAESRSNPVGTMDERIRFNEGDAIAIASTDSVRMDYRLKSDHWVPVAETMEWTADEMGFIAWYPTTATISSFMPAYSTEASSLEELVKNDYMLSDGCWANRGEKVNLVFHRMMTRFSIDKIEYLDGTYNATNNPIIDIEMSSGSKGYEDGELVPGIVTAKMYQHTDGHWYAVLPPTAEDAEGKLLSIRLKGVGEPLIIDILPATQAGMSYNLSIGIDSNGISVTALKVESWTDGFAADGLLGSVTQDTLMLVKDAFVLYFDEEVSDPKVIYREIDGKTLKYQPLKCDFLDYAYCMTRGSTYLYYALEPWAPGEKFVTEMEFVDSGDDYEEKLAQGWEARGDHANRGIVLLDIRDRRLMIKRDASNDLWYTDTDWESEVTEKKRSHFVCGFRVSAEFATDDEVFYSILQYGVNHEVTEGEVDWYKGLIHSQLYLSYCKPYEYMTKSTKTE